VETLEHLFISLDSWPGSAAYRAAIGFAAIALFRTFFGPQASLATELACFAILLAALRVLPALMRKALPFSQQAKQIWRERRFTARRFDCYQWQKLFWFGCGMLAFTLTGQALSSAEAALALTCVACGAVGLFLWSQIYGNHKGLIYRA